MISARLHPGYQCNAIYIRNSTSRNLHNRHQYVLQQCLRHRIRHRWLQASSMAPQRRNSPRQVIFMHHNRIRILIFRNQQIINQFKCTIASNYVNHNLVSRHRPRRYRLFRRTNRPRCRSNGSSNRCNIRSHNPISCQASNIRIYRRIDGCQRIQHHRLGHVTKSRNLHIKLGSQCRIARLHRPHPRFSGRFNQHFYSRFQQSIFRCHHPTYFQFLSRNLQLQIIINTRKIRYLIHQLRKRRKSGFIFRKK